MDEFILSTTQYTTVYGAKDGRLWVQIKMIASFLYYIDNISVHLSNIHPEPVDASAVDNMFGQHFRH